MSFNQIISQYKTDVFPLLTSEQQKIFSVIEKCRTPLLGSHLYRCDTCNSVYLLSNSCSNRNCPVCQGNKRYRWIRKQCNNLLNVPYFHVVFTVPDVLNPLFLRYPVFCYNALYHASWNTLRLFFINDKVLAGKGGMFCMLHTWGQTLTLHPHLHCLVPAAGIGTDGQFKLLKGKNKFLFRVKALGKVFRAKFAEELTRMEKDNLLKVPILIRKLMFEKSWVVYVQRPFSTPENVVRYIGMYSHRVAISENRIIDHADGNISFSYKDYKNNAEKKIMQLSSVEFLRRFALHILPRKFMKIRYYGQLNNRNIKHFLELGEKAVGRYAINQIPHTNKSRESQQNLLAQKDELDDIFTITKSANHLQCPLCKTGKLIRMAYFSAMDLINGVIVINTLTAEMVYHSRDGPVSGLEKIIEIEF